MTDIQTLSHAHIQLSESVKALSDTVSRMDERIKDLYEHYKLLSEDVRLVKEASIETRSKLAIVDSFLSKNISERMIKMEEEHRAASHECIEKTASLNEMTREVRGIIRDGQGAMPSILARMIMVENSIKRLMEQAVENRGLIEEYSRTIRSIESKLIRVDWDQQSIQGKIRIVLDLIWKIAIPIIGAFIVWKLGLK